MSDDVRERKLGSVTLRILRDQCIGTGACSKVAPTVLAFDDQQIIDFVDSPPDDVPRETLYEACEVCPVEALQLVDESGEIVAP